MDKIEISQLLNSDRKLREFLDLNKEKCPAYENLGDSRECVFRHMNWFYTKRGRKKEKMRISEEMKRSLGSEEYKERLSCSMLSIYPERSLDSKNMLIKITEKSEDSAKSKDRKSAELTEDEILELFKNCIEMPQQIPIIGYLPHEYGHDKSEIPSYMMKYIDDEINIQPRMLLNLQALNPKLKMDVGLFDHHLFFSLYPKQINDNFIDMLEKYARDLKQNLYSEDFAGFEIVMNFCQFVTNLFIFKSYVGKAQVMLNLADICLEFCYLPNP